MFCKRIASENFGKFTGKHMCWSLFINKVTGAFNVLKKVTLTQVFPCEFCETFKSNFFTEHLRATLPNIN